MVTNPHWLLTFPSRKSHENREGRPVTVFLTVVKVAILLGSISSRKVLPCSRGAPSKFLDTKRDRETLWMLVLETCFFSQPHTIDKY